MKKFLIFFKCTNLSLQNQSTANRTPAAFAQEINSNPETQRTCWEEQEALWRVSGLNSHFSFAPLYLDAPSCEVVKQCLPHQQPGKGEGDWLINSSKYIWNFQCLLMTCNTVCRVFHKRNPILENFQLKQFKYQLCWRSNPAEKSFTLQVPYTMSDEPTTLLSGNVLSFPPKDMKMSWRNLTNRCQSQETLQSLKSCD